MYLVNNKVYYLAKTCHSGCGICGKPHRIDQCKPIPISSHVLDSEVPSRARLTLPSIFTLKPSSGTSSTVIANEPLERGVKFGPVKGRKVPLPPNSCGTNENGFQFKLVIFTDLGQYRLDVGNEVYCNWMMFIGVASTIEEQNLICFQENDEIYYATNRMIRPGDGLKVWYAPHYANLLKVPLLHQMPIKKVPVRNRHTDDINALIRCQQKICDRKVWKCKFCDFADMKVTVFSAHLRQHYLFQMRKNTCQQCQATFPSAKRLEAHKRAVHCPPIVHIQPMKLKGAPPPTAPSTSLGGPLLNSAANDDNDLINYAANDSSDLFTSVDLEFGTDEQSTVGRDPVTERFTCDICLQQFGKLRLLLLHLRYHTGEYFCVKCRRIFCRNETLKHHECNRTAKFQCNRCAKTFAQLKQLRAHTKSVHHDNVNVKHCIHCQKTFKNDTCLQIHVKNTHFNTAEPMTVMTNGNGVMCDICGVYLKSKTSLSLHRIKHGDVRQFTCQQCHKSFHRKDVWRQHCQQTHQKPTTKEIQCTVCPKKFFTQLALKYHLLRVHKKCQKTSKTTDDISPLKKCDNFSIIRPEGVISSSTLDTLQFTVEDLFEDPPPPSPSISSFPI